MTQPAKPPRRLLAYGVGIEAKPNSFGMTHGPSPSLEKMRSVRPYDERACLIRFNEDGTEDILYRWVQWTDGEGWMPVSNPRDAGKE